MCIAIYQPTGKQLVKKTLKTCWDNNPDGAGYMYNTAKGQLVVEKGFMSFKEFWRSYRASLAKNKRSSFVLHFRIATHGMINPANTHPFKVTGNMAFVHNGILSIDVPKGSRMSDTAIFNEVILKKLDEDFLDDEAIMELISGYCGTSKLIFLTNTGKVRIVNETSGTWHQGVWFSNDSYRRDYYAKTVRLSSMRWWYGTGDEDRFPEGYYTKKAKERDESGNVCSIAAESPSYIDEHSECCICGLSLEAAEEFDMGMCRFCYREGVKHGDIPDEGIRFPDDKGYLEPYTYADTERGIITFESEKDEEKK